VSHCICNRSGARHAVWAGGGRLEPGHGCGDCFDGRADVTRLVGGIAILGALSGFAIAAFLAACYALVVLFFWPSAAVRATGGAALAVGVEWAAAHTFPDFFSGLRLRGSA
jgi:hypothetical protein